MGFISKFEDIIAWQKAREFSKNVYSITKEGEFSRDISLKDQILRASGSVIDNIAEGFERGGNKKFIQFLYISKSSNGECRSQLYRALDQNYISDSYFSELYNKSIEIGQLIGGFINYLKESEIKGKKYKVDNNQKNKP